MAIMNITDSIYFRNIFPELTDIQRETLILFCTGFSLKDIALYRSVSVQSATKTLSECIRRYDVPSREALRNVFLIRLLVGGRVYLMPLAND